MLAKKCQWQRWARWNRELMLHSKQYWAHDFVRRFGHTYPTVMKHSTIGSHCTIWFMAMAFKHGNTIQNSRYVHTHTFYSTVFRLGSIIFYFIRIQCSFSISFDVCSACVVPLWKLISTGIIDCIQINRNRIKYVNFILF